MRLPVTPTFFPSERLQAWAERYRQSFASATPFAHAILDDVLAKEVLDVVIDEFPAPDAIRWNLHRHDHSEKLASGEEEHLGDVTRALIHEMNGPRFLTFLETLTGIEGLIPDPWLLGGGLHQLRRGGFLDIHADFNFHPKWGLDRRLNVLLYLNRGWQPEWNGQLELWDAAMRSCCRTIAPIANRIVIFATTDTSFHGHPAPLQCPDHVTRKSLALYYYSNGRPAAERSLPHSTLYQATPR
jgi:hypothetical protein